MDPQTITSLATNCGLSVRGGFTVGTDDKVPAFENGAVARSLVLLGNTGSSIWSKFSTSPELQDGLDNPLDRWSKRIGDALATEVGGVAYYPFGGPPYQPFIQWAQKAESLRPSKLGILLHPDYGLWHAYRLAIAFPDELVDVPVDALWDHQVANQPHRHACDTCQDQPCYNACPVDAFANDHYDVNRCVRYLDANPRATCNHSGCMARMSCPEAEQYRYVQPHALFHISQFVKARLNALDDNPSDSSSI